jgi:hypothetical protein
MLIVAFYALRVAAELGLVISRTMTQSSDTLNHQGAIAVVLNASTLTVTKNLGQTSGHSFGNSITLSSAGDFVGIDLGDNYPRGINMWRFNSTMIRSKLVYQFKTAHGKKAQSPAGVTYDPYPEISDPALNITYYKWSNDNAVYTELAHPGVIELTGAFLVLLQGEQPALDNSKVGKALNAPRDIGLVLVSKDMRNTTVLSTGKTESAGFYTFGGTWTSQTLSGVQWLTAHAATTTTDAAGKVTTAYNQNACRLKTTRIAEGRNVLLYEIWTAFDYVETRLMEIDDTGKITQPAVAVPFPVRLQYADDSFNPKGTQDMVVFSGSDGRLVRYQVTPNGAAAPPASPTATSPTAAPSLVFTPAPSPSPTAAPTAAPSRVPSTLTPTLAPTLAPSAYPTLLPSARPTGRPTGSPTTAVPSRAPTFMPTVRSGEPTVAPTPSAAPTQPPTGSTDSPTSDPSG